MTCFVQPVRYILCRGKLSSSPACSEERAYSGTHTDSARCEDISGTVVAIIMLSASTNSQVCGCSCSYRELGGFSSAIEQPKSGCRARLKSWTDAFVFSSICLDLRPM